jgi:pimeloyl-ACP methyl ester carboxylesterase
MLIRFCELAQLGVLVSLVCACQPSSESAEVDSSRLALTDDCGPRIAWESCEDEQLQMLGAKCGMLSVPLDHARPDGEHILLAVSMIEATAPKEEYQGIIITNPGGPGGEGLATPAYFSTLIRQDAARVYDWIGFDPRGVGSSIPRLSCITDYGAGPRPDYVPDTPELEQEWLKRASGYADACKATSGELLEHMRTEDVARDVELIRQALHAQTVNFYTISYGTYLAQIYATLYPERVRRMVLDSLIDPTRSQYQASFDQTTALDHNMRAWWAWIAEHDDFYHLGATRQDVEAAFYADMQALRAAPAAGVVGPSEWADIFWAVSSIQSTWYAPDMWLSRASLWTDWRATHDPALLVDEYGPATDDNDRVVYLAVTCTDDVWPTDWPAYRDAVWTAYETSPCSAWNNGWYYAPCFFWPAKGKPAVPIVGDDVPPALLISETEDGATPFSGSLEVRRLFPSSSLIATVGGRSHASGLSGYACVDDPIADYLLTGSLPPRAAGDGPDKRCDPLPVAEPGVAEEGEVP